MWVGSEPTHPLQLFIKHKRLMTQKGVTKILGHIHKEIVQTGREYLLSIQERSLISSKQRWKFSTNSVKDREPFSYMNFKASIGHFVTYSHIILRGGPYCLGCRFGSPIIWYPPEGYHSDYEFPEGHEGTTFVDLIQKHSFRSDKEKFFLAYSLTTLHNNYICSRGCETR